MLTIDGTPRRVVSAQFIKQDPPGPPPTLAGRRLPFSTNESAVGGRLVLIVFDLEGIGVGGGRGATVAASRFLDQLAAADRVGVLAFPNGASVDFTTDREKVKQTLMRVVGRGSFFTEGIYNIGLSEAFDIDRGDPSALERVVARECVNENTPEGVEICRTSLREPGAIERDGQSAARRQLAADAALAAGRRLRRSTRPRRSCGSPKAWRWPRTGSRSAAWRRWPPPRAPPSTASTWTSRSSPMPRAAGSSPSMMQDRQLAIDGLAMICRHHPRLDVHLDWHRQQRLSAHRERDDRVLPAERGTGCRGS